MNNFLKAIRERITNLVASNLGSNIVQGLNNSQTQLLALLVLRNGDILNMADKTQRMNELALDNQTPGSHDLA